MTEEKIHDIIKSYMSSWKLVLVSLIVCVVIGVVYNHITLPIYQRTATLLAKDTQSEVSTLMTSSIDLGKNQNFVNLANDLVSITSSQALVKVIKQLHLNTQYFSKGIFFDSLLYGSSLPFYVSFPDIDREIPFSLEMEIQPNGEVTIYNVKGIESYEGETVTCRVGDTVSQYKEKMVLTENPSYKKCNRSNNIYVTNEPTLSLVSRMKGNLSFSLVNTYSMAVNLNYRDYSIERANDILNALASDYIMGNESKTDEKIHAIEQRIKNVESQLDSLYTINETNHSKFVSCQINGMESVYHNLLDLREKCELSRNNSFYDVEVIMYPESCGNDRPINISKKKIFMFAMVGLFLPFLFFYVKRIYLK